MKSELYKKANVLGSALGLGLIGYGAYSLVRDSGKPKFVQEIPKYEPLDSAKAIGKLDDMFQTAKALQSSHNGSLFYKDFNDYSNNSTLRSKALESKLLDQHEDIYTDKSTAGIHTAPSLGFSSGDVDLDEMNMEYYGHHACHYNDGVQLTDDDLNRSYKLSEAFDLLDRHYK